MTTIALAATGVPAIVSNVRISANGTLDDGRELHYASVSGPPEAGMLSATMPWTTGGDGIRVSLGLTRAGGFGQQTYLETLPGDTVSVTLPAAVTLPWPANLISSAPAGPSGSVSWILDGAGTFDAHVFLARWSRTLPTAQYFEWAVFMPQGGSSYDFPALPAALAAYAPSDSDTFERVDGVLIDFVADDGYDVMQQRGERGVFSSFYASEAVKVAAFNSQPSLTAAPRPILHPFVAR